MRSFDIGNGTMNTQKKAIALFQLAFAQHQKGQLKEAQKNYKLGLKLAPKTADAQALYGQLLYLINEAEKGKIALNQAIFLAPKNAAHHDAFGRCLFDEGDFLGAQQSFQNAILLAPNETIYRARLAQTEEALGNFYAIKANQLALKNEVESQQEALLAWQNAVQFLPNNAVLQGQLALSLMKANDFVAAAQAFSESVRLAPQNGQLHFNYALFLSRYGDISAALNAYQLAINCSSEVSLPPILVSFANLLTENPETRTPQIIQKAHALYEKALQIAPDFVNAHANRGLLFIDEDNRQEAILALQKAHQLAPQNGRIAAHLLFQKLHLCQWENLENLENCINEASKKIEAADDISPFPMLALPNANAVFQRRIAENRARILDTPKLLRLDLTSTPKAANAPLRVGYLSSDFKQHATSYLMIEMLEAHDASRIEVFLLSHSFDDQSQLRARLQKAAPHYIELKDDDEKTAISKIAALNLDILIDLKGYTENNKSAWLRYRLAPVQIAWLGFPGTLGAPWIDYIIGDKIVTPHAHQAFFSEKIVQLAGCYQPNAKNRPCDALSTRAAENLPENALVLCSFNQTYKITPTIFSVWLNVLKEVPHAVLWLWASNPWAENELKRHARTKNIDENRLIFAQGKVQKTHLARLHLADLAIDTFPCNGHTTTSDALWAGIPVISLQGETFASRVAASILHEADLAECVTENLADYEQKIIQFCTDSPFQTRLKNHAKTLRETSRLFDAKHFAHKLESLFLSLKKEA